MSQQLIAGILSTHLQIVREPMFWLVLQVDLLLTILTFIGSIYYNNSSIYDPYWSVFPPFALLTLVVDYFMSDRMLSKFYLGLCSSNANLNTTPLVKGEFSIQFVVVYACLLLWAFRLTRNFFSRPNQDESAGNIWTKDQEDWRYRTLRKQCYDLLKSLFGIVLPSETSRWNIPYWTISFLGIHLMPTLIVFITMIPFMSLFFKSHEIVQQYHHHTLLEEFNTSHVFHIFIFLFATTFSLFCIWISHTADVTLHRHLATRKTTSQVLVEGVWRYTRHGNYFGEIGFWWSIWLFGLSFQNDVLPLITSEKAQFNFASLVWCPIVVTILFYVVSIPWVERKMSLKKPKYTLYQEQVSMLIPWLPSQNFSEKLYLD